MKLITATVLAFTAASVLGSPVYSKDTAVYARGLYERDDGEGFLESFEKRKGGELKPGVFKSIATAVGVTGGRALNGVMQIGILKYMIPPAAPPPPIPPPTTIHLKRRDLSSHLKFLEKRRRKGGGDKSASLFKSVAGAAGTTAGRALNGAMQIGILKKMIPPAPPPPPPSPSSSPSGQSPPKPVSPSHPQPPPQPPAPPSQAPSPFIPPAVPPFPHFPPQIPPAVPPFPHFKRRSLFRRTGRLQTFEKRRKRGGDDKQIFKSVSGAAGTMGGRVASSTTQPGLLKTMIPLARRDLSRPVARGFVPIQAIKNAFSRVGKAGSRFHNKTAPARKATKKGLIYIFDGLRDGVKARGLEEDALDELD